MGDPVKKECDFKDQNNISEYAKSAVTALYLGGKINGVS